MDALARRLLLVAPESAAVEEDTVDSYRDTRMTPPAPITVFAAARDRLVAAEEKMRIGRFVAALALKEHVTPNLHVRPLVAELFLTDNCNLRCVSCACWRTTTRNELDTGEWEDVLRQLASLRIVKVNFTG